MQKLRSATAIYEDSETSLQKKSHLDICWRMMMVTRMSLSTNQPRGETGSAGGFWFSSLRHSLRAQRTARKRQDWGSVMRCFAARCCCCGGRGWETEQTASQRTAIFLSIACNSRSSRTMLVQGYRSTATSPVLPPLYVPYVLTSTVWHRTLCGELAAGVASCSAGSCRGNSHLPTTLQPWLGGTAPRYCTKSWRVRNISILCRGHLGSQLTCRPQFLSRC